MTLPNLSASSPFTRRKAIRLLGFGAISSIAMLSAAQAAQLTVIYLGAEDCPACQRFEAYEEAVFKRKLASRGIKFREFHVGSHRYIQDLNGWPSDLMWLHDQLGSKAGTPWFFLVQGTQVISANQSYKALVQSEAGATESTQHSCPGMAHPVDTSVWRRSPETSIFFSRDASAPPCRSGEAGF
jgi:hypothetical protein